MVKLLGQIGGMLEVMSRPGMGTTFWVNFPTEVVLSTVAQSRAEQAGVGGALGKVVFIRSGDGE